VLSQHELRDRGLIIVMPAFTRLGLTGILQGATALALALPVVPVIVAALAINAVCPVSDERRGAAVLYQHKTGTYVWMPAHTQLRVHLSATGVGSDDLLTKENGTRFLTGPEQSHNAGGA
jgi:hypothetical protein